MGCAVCEARFSDTQSDAAVCASYWRIREDWEPEMEGENSLAITLPARVSWVWGVSVASVAAGGILAVFLDRKLV